MPNDSSRSELEETRAALIAKRVAAGADSPIGHRCSNLIEQLEHYARAENEDQREKLGALIRQSMAELNARHQ